MRKTLSILFLLFTSIISAQKPAENKVEIKTAGSKFQFVNRQTLQPVNQLLWDETEPFANGFARVLLNNKFSFVNSNGNPIAPVEFEDARNFVNKLAAVKKSGKWGFINEAGKTVVPFSYEIVYDFEEPVTPAYNNRKWFLLKKNGEVIMPLDINVCYGFKNGMAKITKGNQEGILYPDGKIVLGAAKTIPVNPTNFHNPGSTNATIPCPDNVDFEHGDFTNWQCFIGDVDSVGTTNVITVTPSPPTPNRHTIVPRVTPSAIDPFGLFPTNPPDGSNFAVKLGNTNIGAQAERIRYPIHVPVNDSNFCILYNYAVVFQDPGHTIWTQPRFNAKLFDSATNAYVSCASFEYISTSGLPGFAVSTVNPMVIYKPWSSVFMSLRGYGGKTLYLEFTTADCVRRGHWGYAYVDVETTCGNPVEVQYDCTPPNITTLVGPPGFQTYNWWNQNYTTLLGTGQTLTLNPGPAVNSIIWLEVIPYNNFGCTDTLMVRITGNFDARFDMSADAGCAPKTFTFYNRNLPSSTTLWDFGDGTTGTGDTVTHTYPLPGSYIVRLTVTMPGGCSGTAIHPVTVYPSPNVNPPPNQTLCDGATTNLVDFTGTAGSTFAWTNNNTSIGLAASGSGDIPPFTAANNSNAPVTATITVTPTLASCSGVPQSFTITVNPTPNVLQPANQTLCNGALANAINFSGSIAAATFNWTNNNTSIGLAANGNGNIASFTATNSSNTPVTATITVTPSFAGCSGVPQSFTITVNPTPNVTQPANQTLCDGATTNAINFSGSVAAAAFSWTNNNTSIGLAASGNGSIASFTATNNGNTPVTATITVTPSFAGCPGTAKTFTITVNPTPNVTQPSDQTLCNGAATNAINFSGSVAAATFSWTNNNTSIGLTASGNGSIASFTATNNGNTPVTATITVTPSFAGCPGTARTFTITVNPTPNVTQPSDQTLCNGGTTNTITFTGAVAATIYSWTNNNTSIGLAASGNGSIASFTATNSGNTPVTATITVTPSFAGCPGTARTFTITVNPTPNVTQPSNQALCNGATTNTIAFSGSVAATTFSWTNNNTSIGLAANGNGNIPAFTAANSTNAAVTATITVTPSAAGCPGTPQTFTITVKPTPDVNRPADQTLCNSSMTSAVNFTGNVAGTTFGWTNNNTSIGLAASGTGNIAPFAAINYLNSVNTGTITVTPGAVGCVGAPESFAINVNPTPDVVQPPSQAICNSTATNAIIFSGAVNGTIYNWTNTAISIGLPASGTGNIAPFTAVSNGSSTSVATITVTPNALGCNGPSKSFTITVNPIPSVAQPTNQALCNGATTNAVSFTGTLSSISTYTWTNSNPSIGLPASGTGNIPAFTAVNTANAPVTAVITVTPSTSACPGVPRSFTITVHPTPAVNASNDMNVCLGKTAQLSASGASQYTWTPSTGLSCTNCSNPSVTPTSSIKYMVKGESAFGCFAFDSVSLSVIRPFQMLVTPNDTLCIGESTGLRATGANSYLWSPSQGLSNVNIADPVATPTRTTLYKVIGYDAYGCFADTNFVKIDVGPKPTLNLGPDITTTTGTTLTFNPITTNGPIVSWTWTPTTGLSCTTCPNPSVTVKDNGYYVLNIKNNYGCLTTDTVLIFVFCKSAQVFIPNAFTPDGDGLNDVLMVRGKGIFVKTFRIFNRWGELVFEKTNFDPNDPKYGWDGKVRGVPATPDVFVYTAEVICDNGVMYTYKGNTTVLK